MTTSIYKYTSALITSDFKVASPQDLTKHNISIRLMYSASNAGDRLGYIQDLLATDEIYDTSTWENISASDCIRYGTLQTDRSTLLIISNATFDQIYVGSDASMVPYQSDVYSYILQGFLRHNLHPVHPTREKGWSGTSQWQSHVSYCLSRRMPGRARLHIHLWLLFATTVWNAVKLACLFYTLREQRDTPLVTLGDAIASFLTKPCPHTVGMSVATQRDILRRLKSREDAEMNVKTMPARFEPRQLRFYHAVSVKRWVLYITS